MTGRIEVECRGGAVKYRGTRSSVSGAIPATLITLITLKEVANGDGCKNEEMWRKRSEEV